MIYLAYLHTQHVNISIMSFGHQRAGKSQLSTLTFSESALPKPLRCCHTHCIMLRAFRTVTRGGTVAVSNLWSFGLGACSVGVVIYQCTKRIPLEETDEWRCWNLASSMVWSYGKAFFWKHRSSWKEGLGMVPPVLAVRLGAEAVGGGKDVQSRHARCIFLRFPWQ